jgi:hypothetical protein
MYDIIVRFKSKAEADAWCGQMSDGAGEGWCDFSFWHQKPGTDGTKDSHFEKVKDSAPPGTPVFFMNELFDL